MKKLSEVHAEHDAALTKAAQQHGYKVDESANAGSMAEFNVKMNRSGMNAEIIVEANGEVLYYGAGTLKDMTDVYSTILKSSAEALLPYAAGRME